MADNISYSTTSQYLPHAQYYSTPHVNHGHVHAASPDPHPELAQRKRPKYTRSKTGCMTCRVKKIKCDETKPTCMRCTHGQRDCTWPEGVPTRKKSGVDRRDSVDGRPSTADSSEGSTPPTRDRTPPGRSNTELHLLPSPRDQYIQSMNSELDPARRQHPMTDRYPHTTSNTNTLPMTSDGHYDSRYGSPYTHAAHHHQHQPLRQPIPSSYRSASSHQPPVHHWQQSPELVEPYYHHHPTLQHSPSNEPHNRY